MGTVFDEDIGPRLIVDMAKNQTNAAANFPVVRLKKPDGTFLQRDYGAGPTNLLRLTLTDTVNGVGYYEFQSGELVTGTWNGQARTDWTDGKRTYGEKFTFSISAVLA